MEKKTWLDKTTRVRCQRLALAGEILELRARRLDGKSPSHQVEFWDEEGSMVGTIDYTFAEVDGRLEKSKL